MYEAKRSGRGRIQGFEHALSDRISTRMALEGQLRGAHERGEMRLVYQPVVELTTRRIVAVEALLRWTHPDLGNVTPLEFIELAERTGAIVELGAWALNRAVAQAAAWAANGLALDVAVNVSARQLGDPAFPAFVADCLERHGLPAERLSLELTESIVMERRGDAADRLEELTATGLRLAIDDFGTGYSSLQRLRALPVNTLKVDRSFVDGLHTDPHDEAIVTATLSMARTMGLDVVAEGVENDAQAGKLLDLGCGLAQGFLFSRPLEPVQVAPLLTARRRAVRA
jgi:EAL domain-containing protein (putative c-di-GMP-specific phosphodiesterase class I)